MKNLSFENIVVLDTETTGLEADAEILQLSIIDIDGNILWNRLYRPERHSSWEAAAAINGITPEMVADKPLFSEDREELLALLKGKIVAGFNVRYDIDRLLYSLNPVSFENKSEADYGFRSYDVRHLWLINEGLGLCEKPASGRHRLCDAVEVFGFKAKEGERLHDSLTDVKATLHVFLQCVEALSKEGY